MLGFCYLVQSPDKRCVPICDEILINALSRTVAPFPLPFNWPAGYYRSRLHYLPSVLRAAVPHDVPGDGVPDLAGAADSAIHQQEGILHDVCTSVRLLCGTVVDMGSLCT
jgi:hypothetical protein